MFIHNVYFWFKSGLPKSAAQAMIADGEAILKKIPTVRHIWSGMPTGQGRDIVDNSYDVGLCVAFDDSAGHDLYQDHPLHKQYIERHGKNWERIVVYDFR